MALVDWSDHEHVGTVHIDVEPFRDVLAQDRWCKRAKALAVLDLQIELLLHLRVARIGEDRAIAEGARTKLHAPLKPADGLAVGERLCGAVEQLIARKDGVARARRLEPRLRLAIIEFGAETRSCHAVGGVCDGARSV